MFILLATHWFCVVVISIVVQNTDSVSELILRLEQSIVTSELCHCIAVSKNNIQIYKRACFAAIPYTTRMFDGNSPEIRNIQEVMSRLISKLERV